MAPLISLCGVSQSAWVQIAERNVRVTVEYDIADGPSSASNSGWILVAFHPLS
jgi:hypothetical protein